MVFQWSGGKFFIFLTDWGFLLCMITCVYGAVLVSINYCRPFDSGKLVFSHSLLKFKAKKFYSEANLDIQDLLGLAYYDFGTRHNNYCRILDIPLATWVVIFKDFWFSNLKYWISEDAYSKGSTRALTFNAFQHACNTGVMFFDQFMVAFPTRLLHVIYPLGLGVAYALFSAIYYGAGGTDPWVI